MSGIIHRRGGMVTDTALRCGQGAIRCLFQIVVEKVAHTVEMAARRFEVAAKQVDAPRDLNQNRSPADVYERRKSLADGDTERQAVRIQRGLYVVHGFGEERRGIMRVQGVVG